MKHIFARTIARGSLILCMGSTFSSMAQLSIPSADGTDGALIVSNSMTIDLSQAGNDTWTNASANPGKGTYDSNQWAVVFKYSSVVISNNATLTFSNHPTHAPVVWLVSNNVTINGTLSLDGQSYNSPTLVNLADGGPGGFRGGSGSGRGGQGSGFGPGGGAFGFTGVGGAYAGSYGNTHIVPLIGGSGGGGGGDYGGAGGGAILIAASGTITVSSTGSCHSQGSVPGSNGGGGSGGAIRLVASQITGTGLVYAQGAGGYGGNGNGSAGQIRLECTNTSFSFSLLNPTPTTLTLASGASPVIFPPDNTTSVSIVSIIQPGQTNNVPADPLAAMAISGNDDVRIVTTNTVTIRIQTKNFPTNGTVNLYIRPREGYVDANNQTKYLAILDPGGTTNLATWHVSTALPYPKHIIVQARAFY